MDASKAGPGGLGVWVAKYLDSWALAVATPFPEALVELELLFDVVVAVLLEDVADDVEPHAARTNTDTLNPNSEGLRRPPPALHLFFSIAIQLSFLLILIMSAKPDNATVITSAPP